MAKGVAFDVRQANLPNGRSIYDLITENNLDGIRSLFNPLTLRHRKSIVCQKVCDKTLLGHACELGFTGIVKYLLDECEADISEDYIHSTMLSSPLRVSLNNLDLPMFIVLLRRGVVVSDRYEAIKFTYYVLKNNDFSIFSILKECIDGIQCMEYIAELPNLLSWVNIMDLNNARPFLKASARGEIGTMKILVADCIYPKVTNNSEENALCVAILNEERNSEHVLLNYRVFSLKDYVRAIELCGAKFIVFQSDFEKGMRCWRKALRIRSDNSLGVSDKFENKLKANLDIEFNCEKQLEMYENNNVEIYTQALLVFLRLLSPSSQVLHDAFVIVTQHPFVQKDFFKTIEIVAVLFELPCCHHDGLISPIRKATYTLDMFLIRYFHIDPSDLIGLLNNFQYLIDFIKGVNWVEFLGRQIQFYRLVYTHILNRLLYFIIALSGFEDKIGLDNKIWIRKTLSEIMQWYHEPYPITLLQLSIDEPMAFPVIPFLLSCLDDVNCTEKQRNTPMQTVSLQPVLETPSISPDTESSTL